MGSFRFRKQFKLAPGLKLTVNRQSVGITLGGRGAHLTYNTKGQRTASVGLPGTGLWYRDTRQVRSRNTPPPEQLGGSQPVEPSPPTKTLAEEMTEQSMPEINSWVPGTPVRVAFELGERVECRTGGQLYDGIGTLMELSILLDNWGTPVHPVFRVVIDEPVNEQIPHDLWYTEICLTKVGGSSVSAPFQLGERVARQTSGGASIVVEVSILPEHGGTPDQPAFHVVIDEPNCTVSPRGAWYGEAALKKTDGCGVPDSSSTAADIISGNGTYLVGTDIQPGLWRSAGSADGSAATGSGSATSAVASTPSSRATSTPDSRLCR
jgi:hypothetical protein